MSTAGRFSDEQKDDIRAREHVSAVFERLGQRLKRTGRTFVCLCPLHAEKTPSCVVDDSKGLWHCKGCAAGGDVFDAVMNIRGCDFPAAVEWLGGVRELTDFDRARIDKRRRDLETQAAADARRAAETGGRLWAEGKPLGGSHAAEYLECRGIAPNPAADLRFHPALPYWGFRNAEADKPELMGEFPAMLGAIRSNAGALIGIHRTFLDPSEPTKLKPGGCPKRNRAKKIIGEQMGGSIALTPRSARMAYGEGIETTYSWRVLMGARADGFGLAALVSLGNISGGAMEHRPHPTKRHPDGRPVLIPNGHPDLERPGFMPGPDVREALLLGDGDSEPAGTRASLLTALRRWREHAGPAAPLQLGISMAPADHDFNDVLQAQAEGL